MDFFGNMISKIHWGQPSVLLAIIAVVLLLVFAKSKNRFTFTYLVSAGIAGAGFLLNAWVGLLTLSLAISYRLFQNLKKPWQTIITISAGFSFFALLSLLVQSADPQASKERSSGNLGGVLSFVENTTTAIATNKTWILVFFFGGLVIAGYFFWLMRRKKKYPYYGEGADIDRAMMYNGLVNPHLTVIPEEQRDPRRSFPVSERKQKLKEQDGFCAYQTKISQHPKWDAYRSGVQWHGDHIIPHAVGGATNFENLQILCADCNSAKSDKYGKAAETSVSERWENA